MSKVLIIADDLTGANATSVLLARKGFKVETFLNLDKYDREEDSDLNVISISTDSRGIRSSEAYDRVSKVVETFSAEDIGLYANRIDSTLRGNIGVETDAILDGLLEDTLAIVVPSFPSSGRVCIGGYVIVNQVPLERTDAANDVKTPINTSRVVKLLQAQTDRKVGFIGLDRVLGGEDQIIDKLNQQVEEGAQIVVVDATTDQDILTIAKAIDKSGRNVISVDPGPFTSALSELKIGSPSYGLGKKVLLTIGSVTAVTRKQIDELISQKAPLMVSVDARKIIDDKISGEEIDRVVGRVIKDIHDYHDICVTTMVPKDELIDLSAASRELNITEDEVAQKISKGLATITREILDKTGSQIGGLYTSGGDVTVEVCNALEAAGIEVKDEIIPLAVYGRIAKGKFHNTAIVTKGGLIGDEDTIVECVNYLSTKISTEHHEK